MTLGEFPAMLRELVEAFPADRIRIRAGNGRFAVVEHVWHLADLEEEGYGPRIIRLLSENRPSLPDFHGDVIAEERNYLAQELAPALERFTRVRAMNAALLASLTDDQRQRKGDQEGVGEVTLGQVEEMMRGHDREHFEELQGLMRELS